jgi:GTP cyclohydrolase II
MFTYIDPNVRQRLVQAGSLIRIGRNGESLDSGTENSGETISILGPIPLPLAFGKERYTAQWYACVRNTQLSSVEHLAETLRAQKAQESFATLATSMAVNSVLLFGDPGSWSNPLVRVHSSCLTGDVFGSERCECGPQLQSAVKLIDADSQGGMLVYMSGHEGRGIGLWAKAATYLLQDSGEDTYQANRSLGLPDDSRDFSDAASLIKYFCGDVAFRLLTNNPKKVADLNAAGLQYITPVKHVFGVTDRNRGYLAAKRNWGHKLDDNDFE